MVSRDDDFFLLFSSQRYVTRAHAPVRREESGSEVVGRCEYSDKECIGRLFYLAGASKLNDIDCTRYQDQWTHCL